MAKSQLFILSLGIFLSPLPVANAKAKTEIVIATDATYPPFESVAPDGKLVGFEVELAQALCLEMQDRCKLVNIAWDGLIPGLLAGKFDALMASMNIAEDRKRVIAFSSPYYELDSRFVVKKGAGITVSKEGLKGKTIAVQTGTTQDKFVTELFGNVATIKRYVGANEPYLELLSGRADLHFGSVVQIEQGFLDQAGNSEHFELIGPVFNGKQYKQLGEGAAVGLRKSDTELRENFDRAIAQVISNGTLKRLSLKYLRLDISPHASQHQELH